jgi:hypothetical protein
MSNWMKWKGVQSLQENSNVGYSRLPDTVDIRFGASYSRFCNLEHPEVGRQTALLHGDQTLPL